MRVTRRTFTGAVVGIALGSQQASASSAEAHSEIGAALAAIRAYGDAHLRYNHLPGMTLGLVTPDGQRTVLNFGYANSDARTPITPDTLFQIGSISKVMLAAVLHQLASEKRISLGDRLTDRLPAVPLPAGNLIELQHLLDHVAGLPEGAPIFPKDGLWTAYAPGKHWHYSNVAYEILGKLVEHLEGKPLRERASRTHFRAARNEKVPRRDHRRRPPALRPRL